MDGAGLRSAVSVVWRAGDGGTASLARSGFGEIVADGTGASVVTPGLACGATKGTGGSGVLGLAVAEVIVAPSDFDPAAVVPVTGLISAAGFTSAVVPSGVGSVRSTAPFDSAVAPLWAARLITGNGFAPARILASAMGLGPGFVSATAVGVNGAGTDAAGEGGRESFGSVTDSTFEPLGTGDAVAGAEA